MFPGLCDTKNRQNVCRNGAANPGSGVLLPGRSAARAGMEESMKTMDLNGTWRLQFFTPGAFSMEETEKDTFFPNTWMETNVPEDVRTVLRRNGYITGHFYGKNLDAERWIDEKDWVYYREFYVEKEREQEENVLCLEGVDTLASVWVNGRLVGNCRNMFLEHCFDVTAVLQYGGWNRLCIQIYSPLKATEGAEREGIYPENDTTRMLLRKSQMNWGWDFCGHCLSVGIWKKVFLRSRSHALLSLASLTTEELVLPDGEGKAWERAERAVLRLRCEIDGDRAAGIRLTLRLAGETVYERELPAEEAADVTFSLDGPALWWPRPYGTPVLYQAAVQLLDGEGAILDEKRFRFGIRTVRLLQEKEEGGRSFWFCVNGKRLFIRGANWVPVNCIYGEIRDEAYDRFFARVLDSNLSMLRVWGGGIYESDHFLDLCDENGILVFWDMMFACGIYPQDEAFLRETYEEVYRIVRKYQNRTCVAVWSADNELDEAYRWYDLLDHFQENKVNREAIRQAVEDVDQSRPFLVSSPCSPFAEEEGGDDPNSDRQGDMHLYLTRFQKGDEYYYKKILEQKPRFMSEYGFSSLPWESSFYRFNLWRGQLDLVKNPWLAQLPWLEEAGKRGDFSEIIYDTQLTHAQGLKYWIEYLRSLKWHCGGSLYWKFNDPVAPNREDMLFPSLMSVVDFYHQPKLAYYYARRAYEDVILAFREDGEGSLYVVGCNETEQRLSGTLQVEAKQYDGRVLWREERPAVIEADAATVLSCISPDRRQCWRRENSYVRAFFTDGQTCWRNLFALTETGEWDRVEIPACSMEVKVLTWTEENLELWIRADSFAQDVTLELCETPAFYSDNSFCLEAGEEKRVTVRPEKGDWQPAAGRERLRVRAFYEGAFRTCCVLCREGQCTDEEWSLS